MKNQTDRLSALRAKYQEIIRSKRAEIEALQQKIVLIDEVQSDASLDALDSAKGQYSELSLTEAVLLAMREIGENNRVTVADVRKHLINNGFVPRGKNFTISVAQVLRRAVSQKKISTELTDGKRTFWKEPTRYEIRVSGATNLPPITGDLITGLGGITGGTLRR
jgi:uncharacterized protein (DUF2267 family)